MSERICGRKTGPKLKKEKTRKIFDAQKNLFAYFFLSKFFQCKQLQNGTDD